MPVLCLSTILKSNKSKGDSNAIERDCMCSVSELYESHLNYNVNVDTCNFAHSG